MYVDMFKSYLVFQVRFMLLDPITEKKSTVYARSGPQLGSSCKPIHFSPGSCALYLGCLVRYERIVSALSRTCPRSQSAQGIWYFLPSSPEKQRSQNRAISTDHIHEEDRRRPRARPHHTLCVSERKGLQVLLRQLSAACPDTDSLTPQNLLNCIRSKYHNSSRLSSHRSKPCTRLTPWGLSLHQPHPFSLNPSSIHSSDLITRSCHSLLWSSTKAQARAFPYYSRNTKDKGRSSLLLQPSPGTGVNSGRMPTPQHLLNDSRKALHVDFNLEMISTITLELRSSYLVQVIQFFHWPISDPSGLCFLFYL